MEMKQMNKRRNWRKRVISNYSEESTPQSICSIFDAASNVRYYPHAEIWEAGILEGVKV